MYKNNGNWVTHYIEGYQCTYLGNTFQDKKIIVCKNDEYFFCDDFGYSESKYFTWESLVDGIENGEKFKEFDTLEEAKIYYLMML